MLANQGIGPSGTNVLCSRATKGFAVLTCAGMSLLSACSVPPGVGTTVRVLCAFADILVEETELEVARQAFGDDEQIGSKICEAASILLSGDGAQEPSPVTEASDADLPLPDGQSIPVQIVPRSQ